MSQPPRLPWIDHLRTLVIVLVVNMHSCVTYSNVGSWYVNIPREPSRGEKILFILWQGHLQSFFMGLLFFVSGYFAHGSLVRRGPGAFMRERLFRLGMPTLFYALVIHPYILKGINPWQADFGPFPAFYGHYLISGRFLGSTGPLWFAAALLIFSGILAGWRKARGAGVPAPDPSPPAVSTVLLFALGIGAVTFGVRLLQPLGTDVLNMQLGYFTQYIAAFAAGVAAARNGWLLRLAASRKAAWCGWMALVLGPAVLLALLVLGSKGGIANFAGGWHWQAFGLAVWEQFAGVGLSLGLIYLFAARLGGDTPALRWLADRSFGVYVLHAPVLVWLYLVLPQAMSPFALAFLMTIAGLGISFVLADIARRTPGLRTFL